MMNITNNSVLPNVTDKRNKRSIIYYHTCVENI